MAQTFGVKHIIIAVNKMDCIEIKFSEKRYKEIKQEMSKILIKIGYDPYKVPFIPISAYEGDNLYEVSKNMPWFTGWVDKDTFKTASTLIEAIDLF